MLFKQKVFSALALLCVFFYAATGVRAELIQKFNSDIVINKNGTIQVTEVIHYDFENEYRHGIYRDIPLLKRGGGDKKFVIEISGTEVTDEKYIPYKTQKSIDNNVLRLKIGDPRSTITGTHIYRISYQVSGALSYFENYDELYWNITGNGWNVPIVSSVSRIILPLEFTPDRIKSLCFTGVVGSTSSECTHSFDTNTVTITSDRELSGGEGITAVVSFPKKTVATLPAKEYVPFFETPFGKIVFVIGMIVVGAFALFWYVAYPIYIIVKWYREGRDPSVSTGVVSAWFEPPQTRGKRSLTPAETGTIIDETVHPRDVVATLIHLAHRKYLLIEERSKNKFFLIRKKQTTEGLMEFEKKLLLGIFKESENEVEVSSSGFYTTVEKVQKSIYEQVVTDGFFPENPNTIRTFYGIVAFFAFLSANIHLGIIALTFGFFMPRKTALGRAQANVAQSLKNFLTSQEHTLTDQANKQLFFEKLLPYAVAFGVEKKWAKRFENFTLHEPSWYKGHSGSSFNSVIFVSHMHSLSNSFTPPSSSSSGMSGGFSGGGGGGGGGGSW